MISGWGAMTVPTQMRSPIMVGRDRELARLEAAALAALRGESRAAIVTGDAGAGKSRLAGELSRRARTLQMVTLHGECSESETSVPYLPLVEAISRHLEDASERARVTEALGDQVAPLGRVVPRLRSDDRFDVTGTALDKLRLFEAFVSLLRTLASPAGLVLVVEDVHWADSASLELLEHVMRRLQSAQTVLVMTVRDSDLERAHPLRSLLQRWARAGADTIALRPLSIGDVAGMAAAIFGVDGTPATMARQLHERTDGLPFAIEELLRQAVEQGGIGDVAGSGWQTAALPALPPPRSLSDGILVRSTRLSNDHLDVLRCAAVLGRGFDFPVLRQMSDLDADVVLDALDACVDVQLIEEDRDRDDAYRFRHILIRDAIYNDVTVSRRQRLHGRAAEALRAVHPDDPAGLARHLLAAGRAEEAARACADAADLALRRLAPREAMDLFAKALAHSSDPRDVARLQCSFGEAAHQEGDIAAAQEQLEFGITALEDLGEETLAAHHRLTLGRCYWLRSRHADAARQYDMARERLEEDGPGEDLAVSYIRLAGLHATDLEAEEAERLARRAIDVACACDSTEQRVAAADWLGMAMCLGGKLDAGTLELERSREQARLRGLSVLESRVVMHLLSALETYGRVGACPPLLERLRGLPLDPFVRAVLPYYESWIDFWSARLVEAARAARRSIEIASGFGMEGQAGWGRALLCLIATELGDLDAAASLVPPLDPALQRQERLEQGGVALRHHLAAGDVESAHAIAADLAAEPWAIAGTSLSDCVTEALLARDRLGDAERLIDAMDAHPRAATHRGHLLRARGRVALARGDGAGAIALLRAAGDAYTDGGYRLEELRTRPLLGDAQARVGDAATAAVTLASVLEDAGPIAAGQIARAAVAVAERAGVPLDVASMPPPVTLDAAQRTAGPEAAHSRPRTVGERLVTVLACGARGLPELSRRLPPADVAERVAALHRWAALAVEQHGGLLQESGSDRVQATFNATGARIDHTRDALEAALELLRSSSRLSLALGAGIAVGPAIVGRLGDDAGITVMGTAADLAARLEAGAGGGEVVLSEEAYSRVREQLPKGVPAPLAAVVALPGVADAVAAFRLQTAGAAGGAATGAPAAPAQTPNRLVREGEFWSLTYQGTVVRLKDAKGLHDLARLIAAPGTEIAAVDLAGVATPVASSRNRADAGLELGVEGDAGEVLDERARGEYRQRLVDLDAELADAEDANDPERASRLRQERSFLIDELGAAVGLTGRSRRTLDPAERARKAVTWRLRDAIGRIEAVHAELGRHLRRSVRTGAFCVYDPAVPTAWSMRA